MATFLAASTLANSGIRPIGARAGVVLSLFILIASAAQAQTTPAPDLAIDVANLQAPAGFHDRMAATVLQQASDCQRLNSLTQTTFCMRELRAQYLSRGTQAYRVILAQGLTTGTEPGTLKYLRRRDERTVEYLLNGPTESCVQRFPRNGTSLPQPTPFSPEQIRVICETQLLAVRAAEYMADVANVRKQAR